MSYGHGAGMDKQSAGKLARSAFVTGTRVAFTAGNGRRLLGEIVGPDQDYFPSPDEVFVSFPAIGFTHLLPVAELEVVAPTASGDDE